MSFFSRGLFVAALTISSGSVTAAEPPLAPELVRLPEFKVLADRVLPPPERWHYARIGRVEFLSNASARNTQAFIRDFQDFQNVLAIISPHFLLQGELPTMIVLCGSMRDPFAIPRDQAATSLTRAIAQDRELATMVLDLEGPAAFLSAGSDEDASGYARLSDSRSVLYRSYITHVLTRMTPPPPSWMVAGTAEIYAALDFSDRWIDFGSMPRFLSAAAEGAPMLSPLSTYRPQPPAIDSPYSYTSPIDAANTLLGVEAPMLVTIRRPIMPLGDMFAYSTGGSPLSDRNDRASPSTWRLQCATFVHFCLYGNDGKYKEQFAQFLARSMKEGVSEALFKECFGIDYKAMQLRLRGYMEGGVFAYASWRPAKGKKLLPPAEKVVLRPATDAEVGRIKGETFRLAGLDEAARNEFVLSYLRGERDPQLLASLGLMARQQGDNLRAATYLELAAKTPTPNPRPRAYLELMRLRREKIHAQIGGRPLTPAHVKELLEPLFVAKSLRPIMADVYREIAYVWENSATPPRRDHLAVLDEGMTLFPANADLAHRSAALFARHGFTADALRCAERGLKSVRDPELHARLEALKHSLPTPKK